MKLVYPKDMTSNQIKALNLCLSSSEQSISKDIVHKTLLDQIHSIEEGVTFINYGIPIADLGRIELLALDGFKRTIVIEVTQALDANAISTALMKVDWLKKHGQTVAHFHRGIHFEDDIRLWIFTAAISNNARPVLRRLSAGVCEVFEYRCLELQGEGWLVLSKFEGDKPRIVSSAQSELPREMSEESGVPEILFDRKEVVPPKNAFSIHSVLTEDEINGFFNTDAGSPSVNDDVTTRHVL